MYGKKSNKQKMKWGAAGQCLLIVLSFLPVWLLQGNDTPGTAPTANDTLTVVPQRTAATAEAVYPLEVPRP